MNIIRTIFISTSIVFVALVSFVIIGNIPLVIADAMSSANYKIKSDSLNVGGIRSTSASYKAEDTAGEIATGDSSSTSYKVRAGYQQMQEVYLALSAAADVTMGSALGGLTGGTSLGQTSTTVITDSAAGYALYIKASSSPALQGNVHGGTIANYTPAGANPDFTFSVAATAAEFGFSPEGADIVQKYKDNGIACNIGSSDAADACWNALSTSNDQISGRSSANHPSGTATTIKFQVGIGVSQVTIADTYKATTTLTVTAL